MTRRLSPADDSGREPVEVRQILLSKADTEFADFIRESIEQGIIPEDQFALTNRNVRPRQPAR